MNPEEYEQWMADPFFYRFPRGESYHDLAVRLEKSLLELEGERTDVFILADASVIRCFYAFYKGIEDKVGRPPIVGFH